VDLVANLAGPDILIVLAVVVLLFGGTQLPKLARSLGSASHEFRKGVEEGGSSSHEEEVKDKEKDKEKPSS